MYLYEPRIGRSAAGESVMPQSARPSCSGSRVLRTGAPNLWFQQAFLFALPMRQSLHLLKAESLKSSKNISEPIRT